MGIDPEWVFKRRKKIERLIGYRPEDFLGDGSYGVVFTTNRPGVALKVTSHKTEAKTLALVRRLRRKGVELPGIVKVRKLVHFVASCKHISNPDSTIYETFDTPWISSPFDKRSVNVFFIVRELLVGCGLTFFSGSLSPYIHKLTKRVKNDHIRKINHVFRKFPELKNTMLTLVDNGIFLWDVRPDNVGTNKSGQLVIHDVVAAEPLPKVTIRSLGMIK